jgi:hypothetical protein
MIPFEYILVCVYQPSEDHTLYCVLNILQTGNILFHEEYASLGFNAALNGYSPMFRNMSSPSSGLKLLSLTSAPVDFVLDLLFDSQPALFLLGLLFTLKMDDDVLLRNVRLPPKYTAIIPRRRYSS